ncbi:MAG: HU family DNA-binding protein [Paludibacteraceae bacterium]|nr:HU family DNA-binding protein [Paludibacteraceae bacterium]
MNKNTLVEAVAAKANVSKKVVAEVINAAIEATTEAIKRGEGMQLAGFATISVVEKPARKARNPRTGETVELPARKQVKIKPGKSLAF